MRIFFNLCLKIDVGIDRSGRAAGSNEALPGPENESSLCTYGVTTFRLHRLTG